MSKKAHVLFVEDDVVDQMAFKRHAEQKDFPYSYELAGSVQEAKKRLNEKKYNAVIMDWDLGDGNCSELYPLVKDTPYIVVTGSGNEEIAVEAMKAGASDYLIKDNEGKGLHLKTLSVTIEKALEKNKNDKELERYREHLEDLVKERTSELQQSEEKFKRITENIFDLIIFCDLKANIQYVSPSVQRILKKEQKDVLDKNLVRDFGIENFKDVFEKLKNGKIVKNYELEWPIDKKTMAFLEFNATPIYENDELIGIQAIARDISERRKLQIQLAETQKMEAIGELAGGIAHDFNNLLTVINGNTEMAMLRNKGDERLEKNLNVVLNAGKRAASLTAQLLAFGRRQMLQNEHTDISGLFKNIETVIERSVGEHINVEFNLDDDLDMADIDPTQFEQAIMNMILNARDAMPEGGIVRLATENIKIDKENKLEPFEVKPGNYVKVTLADNGPGMDDDTKRKVFEPFFTTKKEGTGLGLSTVYGTIRQSKGDIAVESEPGKGTIFTIIFPAVAKKKKVEEPGEGLGDFQGAGRILVVDDEEDIRNLAEMVLENFGYSVYSASNGEEALKFLEHSGENIDMLFVDVVMPKMGGSELVKKVRNKDKSMKILFTSGYLDDRISENLDPEFQDTLLPKPFLPEELVKSVRKVMEGVTD